jgi:hypothetical protein
MIIWSAINIRDVWAMGAVLFALDASLAVRDRISPARFVVLTLSMALLGILRSYMFVLVAIGLAISIVATLSIGKTRGFVSALLTAAVCFYIYRASGFGEQWVREASLERMAAIRQGMTLGAESAYLVGADISTPAAAVRFLPKGLGYFWLSPFPWTVRNLRQAAALPEVFFLYWLIPRVVAGGRAAFRANFSRSATVLSVVAVISIAYAFVEGNYGTAYRHRAQVLAPMLALAGIGIAEKQAAKRRTIEAASIDQASEPASIAC